MEFQGTPSSTEKSVNYTVGPDERNVVVVVQPEQRNFEENQLAHDASLPKKTGYGCSAFLVCFGIVLFLVGILFMGIYYGTGDGVNMRGQSLEEKSRPFLYIGLGILIPGILCIAVAIPLICKGKKSQQRRIEMLTYRDLPNYQHPVAT